MRAADVEEARTRRARLDRLADQFVGHFLDVGVEPLTAEPCVPSQDRTILFTNSAVVSFKPFLRGEIPLGAAGVVVRQPCVRVHNLRATFTDQFTNDFILQFEMLGVLAPAGSRQRLSGSVARYFAQVLGLDQADVALRVAADDLDLIGMWSAAWSGPLLEDTHERDYYRWSFGDPGLTGRGATFAIAQGDGTYRDLGNLIAFERDGSVAGYGFGVGVETLAACLDRHPWILHSVPAGAVPPPSTEEEAKLADLVGLLVRLYAEGVRIRSRAQGHVLRKAVVNTLRLAARLHVDEARLLQRIEALATVEAPGRPVKGLVSADLARLAEERPATYSHDLSFWCDRGVTPDELAVAAAQVTLDGLLGIACQVKDVWKGDHDRGRMSVTLEVGLDLPANTGKDVRKSVLRKVAARLAEDFKAELRGEIS
ncbi:hypothetical protein E1295_07185 [Nonomuraea mesophila]|uniref:Alanyl-tRNA synthetase class IIc N-terminal domain-containing protein n=1 Tax=Nonomuraea mesophila TaxID=2530382 RepID=A0A4R5FUH9_9ACTN|nr:alanine--tRNA ligase-related protein [Nonomuraea mesophila]TDE57738.1 hypothetical protein E1295_07185 [Nonomuraea mesophila]